MKTNVYKYFFESALKNNSITPVIIKNAFLEVLKDYFDGNTDSETVSTISHIIYFVIYTPSKAHDILDPHLASLVADLYELSFYLEKAEEGDTKLKDRSENIIKKAKQYLEKNLQ